MKATIQIVYLKCCPQNLKISLLIIPLVLFFLEGNSQDLAKNGNFSSSIDNWNSETVVCPASSTSGWVNYTSGLLAGYTVVWEGSAFLKNKIIDNSSVSIALQQTIHGLIPATGNKIEISMDVIIGEANNLNMSNLPVEYMNDNLVLEVWLGGVRYATIKTPKGWYSQLGLEFGKCYISYFEGASSVNYPVGNSMNNVSNTFSAGSAPYLHPVKNSNWDISIPWDCEKTSSALFEIRVVPSTFFNKTITDVLGQTYSQTCLFDTRNSLDDIAVDNIKIKNKSIINTPPLAVTNLTSSYCGQTSFDLTLAPSTLNCPDAAPNSLKYIYFKDANLTMPIENPANFETTQKEQMVYVVLTNDVADQNLRMSSTLKRELKITRNELTTAGFVGSPYELCSNTLPFELTDIISPISVTGSVMSYFWEKSIGNITGNYTAAAGNNTEISYTPSGLTTANESVTNYYFRRVARSTLNGLTCQMTTVPVEIIVKPCAPSVINKSIEYFDNPGGLNTAVVPNNLFSATALEGQITSIKITKFPTKATSFTINQTSPGAKVAAPITYCGSPAAIGCVGSTFPTGGVTLPTNTSGEPINTIMVVDPLDGSILVEIPYVSIDDRSFVSTEGKASILFGNSAPLSVTLNKFEVKGVDNQSVILNWATESESNFKLFEVESASNITKFERKYEVFANENKQYSAELNNLESGIWYFRLKIIDNDGTFEYSPIKSLVLESKNTVTLKGNPATDFIKLALNLEKGTYQFNLFDYSGKMILTNSKSIHYNDSDFQLNQKSIRNGVYFLRITNQNNQIIATKKIILR